MCTPSPSHAAQREHLYKTSHLSKAFTAVSIGRREHYYYEHPHFTKEKLEAQRDQVASTRSPLPKTKVLGSHAVFTPRLHQGLSLSEGPTL